MLSWNIYKGRKKNWQEDFQRLHGIYDILLLQEAKINFKVADLRQYDPDYSWVFGESFALNKCGSSCGVLTGSRIHSQHAFNWHAPIREPLLNTPKSSVFSFYAIAGSSEFLLMVNTHFINFRNLKAFLQQLKQIESGLAQHRGPILFAGDFNTWNAARKKALFNSMASYGLQPVIFANESRRFLLLDYIFYRGLTIREAHLLHDIRSSDHVPLAFWFRLENPV